MKDNYLTFKHLFHFNDGSKKVKSLFRLNSFKKTRLFKRVDYRYQSKKRFSNLYPKLALFILFMASTTTVKSQVLGYGNSSLGNENHLDGILFTDDVRARVTSITTNSSGNHVLNVINVSSNFRTTSGATGLPTGQVLVIQMIEIGGIVTMGTHEAIDVLNFTPGINELEVNGTLTHSYNPIGANRVQVIQIPEYLNFTLTGGMVTCHPWDGNTGGVLCMKVAATLDIQGGYFSVAGKGFYPEGVTWGTPGAAGTGSSNIGTGGTFADGTDAGSGGGNAPCKPTPCLTGEESDIASISTANYNGGEGEDCSTCGGTSGTNSSGTGVTYLIGSFLNTHVRMGDAGYYKNGTGAGDGGNGGGAGGGGGSSNSGTPGNDGQPGFDGGDGGTPGKGARGGGIMYIKAGLFDIDPSASLPVFYGGGGKGESGGPGKNGGNGGAGGAGGAGGCYGGSAEFDGGHGGSGSPGDPSSGGDGGNGGEAGYLWLISFTTNTLTAADVDVSGGKEGKGGPGGFSESEYCDENITNFEIDPSCSLDIEYCDGDGECEIVRECNCAKAYERLALTDDAPVDNGSEYEFYYGSLLVATYDPNDAVLTGYEIDGGCTTKYYCPVFEKAICNDIFAQFLNEESYAGVFSFSTGAVDVISSSPLIIDFGDDPASNPETHTYFTYYNDYEYIEDYTNPLGNVKCHNAPCLASKFREEETGIILGEIKEGNPGSSGEPAPDGSTVSNDPEANFPHGPSLPSPGSSGWKTRHSLNVENPKQELPTFNIYPNPTKESLTLNIQTESIQDVTYQILDMNGKSLLKVKLNLNSGQNKHLIDVSELSSGNYIIVIEYQDYKSELPFIKE